MLSPRRTRRDKKILMRGYNDNMLSSKFDKQLKWTNSWRTSLEQTIEHVSSNLWSNELIISKLPLQAKAWIVVPKEKKEKSFKYLLNIGRSEWNGRGKYHLSSQWWCNTNSQLISVTDFFLFLFEASVWNAIMYTFNYQSQDKAKKKVLQSQPEIFWDKVLV